MYSVTATAPIRASASALPKTGIRVLLVGGSYCNLTPSGVRTTRFMESNGITYKTGKRMLSSTPRSSMKEFFPKVETKQIVEVESAWKHPV